MSVLFLVLVVLGHSATLSLAGRPATSAPPQQAGALQSGGACDKLPRSNAEVSITTFHLKPPRDAALALFESKFNDHFKSYPDSRAAWCWAKANCSDVTCVSIWKASAPAKDPLAAILAPNLAGPPGHDSVGNAHMLIYSPGSLGTVAGCEKLPESLPPKGSTVTVFDNHIKPDKWAQGVKHFEEKFLPATYRLEPRRAMIHWVDNDTKSVKGISIWQDPKYAFALAKSPKRQVLVDAAAPYLAPPGIEREYAILVAQHLLPSP